MASLTRMCTLKSIKFFNKSFSVAKRNVAICSMFTFHHSKNHKTVETSLYFDSSQNLFNTHQCSHCITLNRHYSTLKQSGTGLTDSILKDKLNDQTPDKPESQFSESEQRDHEGENTSDSNKKSQSWFRSLFTQEKGWKVGIVMMTLCGVSIGTDLFFKWGPPAVDAEGNEIRDEFSDLPKWEGHFKRFLRECRLTTMEYVEPSSKKLLPDPLKLPYVQPPYTLVLEMTGVLVHPDWTLSTGWRFKKRPHIDYLLQNAGPPLFEVVIYTKEQGMSAFPIVDGLDPNGFISYRLFRDATRYVNGVHCKDLSCLNRDESKIIIVDCDPKAVKLQPRNAVTLRKWEGADGDKTLIDLANFLLTIGASRVDDVRTVLDYYNQFDDPLEAFKERQAQLQQQQEQAAQVADQSKTKGLAGTWAPGFGRRRGQ